MTPDDAREIITRAVALGLSGAEFLLELGPAKVASAYNGIGPAWLPYSVRDRITSRFQLFVPAAVIHDCRFEFANDGTDATFRSSNNELERNCLIIADATYRWYSPMRYIARHRGKFLARMCREFGWSAWRDAYQRRSAR